VNTQVFAAGSDEQRLLGALFELYAYDFSEILGLDVGDDGHFRTPPLDAYWIDPWRHAFLIRVDERLAGFALVHERSRLTGDEGVHDMAEFFVMRRYRRHGVGEHAARWLFAQFHGKWEVRQKAENHAATAFWRRAIGRYTSGQLEERVWNDERWQGPVQRFESRPLEVVDQASPSRSARVEVD
jgi:predicted acetyltransferase